MAVCTAQSVVVNSLDDVLGSEYMRIVRSNCFQYDGHLGSFAQTKQMHPINSQFEATVDLSAVEPGSIFQFTLHRNSYLSHSSQNQNQL